MKTQFAHEAHNRQDRAHKADYREEMPTRRGGTWSGISTRTASGGNYIITLQLNFTEVKPLVAEALRAFDPNIDFRRLAHAVRSEICRHHSTLRRATANLAPSVLAREVQKLSALACKTVPGRFLRWHDSVPDDESATPPVIPAEFHHWLRKLVRKQNTAVTTPAASSAPPSAPSSPLHT
jgi:hypothetical protein